MKKKILISLFTLILSSFFIVSLASKNSKSSSGNDVAAQNNNIMINSPLFTAKEDEEKRPEQNISFITEEITFEKVLTVGKLELWIDPSNGSSATGAIRVVNTETGYVWCSDVPNYHVDSASTRRTMKSSIQMAYASKDKPRDNKYDVTAASNITLTIDKSKLSQNIVSYKVSNTNAKIEFTYTITLTETGIQFDLLADSIKETGDKYVLKEIQVFPYLGTTINKETPGYVFIPSGNGALVRYSSDSILSATGYTTRYYGSDENYARNNEADILSLPLYGMVHGVNEDALLTRIKSGSAMASLTYIPAVGNNPFNRAFNTFTYREATSISIPGGSKVDVYDEELTKEDISVSYSFLTGDKANYVGMALQYQEDLVNEKVLTANKNSGSTNVHVDVFGGETENGILFDKFVKMTTTKQLVDINHELTSKINNHIKYTLRGYYRKGYSYQSYSNTKFNSKLGSLSDLEGLDYSLYYNPVESYNDKLSYPSNVLVSMDSNKHYVEMEKDEKYKFYTKVDSVISGVKSTLDKYDDKVVIDALGYRLYGDSNAEYRRTDTMDMYAELLGDSKYSLYKPNEYLLANTSEYLTTPLYHGRLRFITDSVPFLQIVLRGYVDYYSTYLNFSTNQEIDVLKCIEYGSNPAYLISYEESHLLSNTLSNHLYATHYGSNKQTMIAQINEITNALSGVVGQSIVARDVLEAGVIVVTYSNNVKIYVNYTNSDYTVNNVVVESMGYKVV